MPRLLVRSAKDPFLPVSAEATLARNVIGNNAGNLLFGQAVHLGLSVAGTEVVADAYLTERPGVDAAHVARVNEEFDAFVVPLANAFRPDFAGALRRLTRVIEQLSIPVVVVGVGAQLAADGRRLQEQIQPEVRAFMRAVLDRSARVGVRGGITATALADLGFGAEHVDVIGCPSLFVHGRDHVVTRQVDTLRPDSPVAVNLTPTRPRMAAILNANLERYEWLTYIPQETKELALMIWGEPPSGGADLSFPLHLRHPVYRDDQVRFFLDPITWRDFLATQHFAFGTRIHGNIAALAAGTPAHVLTFDSRTTELADYHAIPHTALAEVASDVDAAELYEHSDPAAFNAAHPRLYDHYVDFLRANGLTAVEGSPSDQAEPALREVAFPPPVRSPLADDVDARLALLDRLGWLRQGNAVDRHRVGGSFTPSFVPGAVAARTVDLDDLSARIVALETESARLRAPRPPATLRARVRRILRRLR